jgi:hypothetical protein
MSSPKDKVKEAGKTIVGLWVLKWLCPTMHHRLVGCYPLFFFIKRCSDCWMKIERGDSLSGWVPEGWGYLV